MPLVAATNKSGFEIRRYLASRYHVETIVTSHDPERIYFSENTSIGEMLLICRRWPDSAKPKPPTRVVNLAINPPTPSDAISVAGQSRTAAWRARAMAPCRSGLSAESPPATGARSSSFHPTSASGSMSWRAATSSGQRALGEIAKVGPAGQRIREAYRRSSMPDAQGRMALWQHDTNVTQTISARPDTHIASKPQYAHRADKYWEQRSRLLLPTHLNLPTAQGNDCAPRHSGCWLALGALQHRRPAASARRSGRRRCACSFNSSVGILSLLGDRTNKKPTYPNLSIDDMRKLTVPDFPAIGETAVQTLAAAYDSLADRTLLPLSQMDSCDTRRALDTAVCAALDIDPETVHTIRRSLAAEPSVTGKRYAGSPPG